MDKFHGKMHSRTCPCNPWHRPDLASRIRKVNTSVAEQIFAWFRGYAATFNNMRPARHHFLVLVYCKRHNEMMDAGDSNHLNPYAKIVKKRPAGSYGC